MRPSRAVLAALCVAILALTAGCSPAAPSDQAQTGQQATDGAADGQDAAPSGRIELSGYVQDHPGATTVVTALEVDDNGDIYVEIDAVASRRNVVLGLLSTILEDDRGNRYEYVAAGRTATCGSTWTPA